MRKLSLIALAAVVAIIGVTSAASARSNRGGPVWRIHERQDGGKAESRRDASRDARRDRKDDDQWRHRDRRRHRPFFLFRHDRGEYCFLKKVQVQDASGNVSIKRVHVCE